MAISDSLARKVESDVKGSQEIAIESQVKSALSELKDKFKYEESYLSTLYEEKFGQYLRKRVFENQENLPKEITAINNTKQKLIKEGLEAQKSKESKEHSPNWVTRNVIYPICGISQKLENNGKYKNVIKGVIDELMAIPDMVLQIFKNPVEFAKSLGQLIIHPKDLWNALKQAYGDAFTQGLGSPEAQYRTGRSVTLIALTFVPGGLGKSLTNVAKSGVKFTSKQVSRVSAKVTGKSTVKHVSKAAEHKAAVAGFAEKSAQKAEQATKAATKAGNATKKVTNLENSVSNLKKTLTSEKRKLNNLKKDPVKNADAISKVEKSITEHETKLMNQKKALESSKISERVAKRESETAERVSQASEKMVTPQVKGKFGQSWESFVGGLSELPVAKQIVQITRRTGNKLGRAEELWFKSAHPDLYKTLVTRQQKLLVARSTLAKNASALENSLNTLVKVERSIKPLKTRISKMEEALKNNVSYTLKSGRKISGKELEGVVNKAKAKLKGTETKLIQARSSHDALGKSVSHLTEGIEGYEKALAEITKKARNIKLRDHAVDAQIIASLLYSASSNKIDKEIEEAISGIDENGDDLDDMLKELEKLLEEYEGSSSGLNSGETVFQVENIILPEGIDWSEVDPSTYTITLIGLASKTGSRAVNERIAQQRAESAKQILMEKYGITDNGQIVIETDLQSDHSDRLGDSLSDWQGVRIKLEPKKSDDNSKISDEDSADERLDEELENID